MFPLSARFQGKVEIQLIRLECRSQDRFAELWPCLAQILRKRQPVSLLVPSRRFVASCGFTPDVKVWEVCFNKKGDFREVTRAFELKGHTAGVPSFSFSNDSRRYVCVTCTELPSGHVSSSLPGLTSCTTDLWGVKHFPGEPNLARATCVFPAHRNLIWFN